MTGVAAPIAFSPEWADALGHAIDESEEYRESGENWEGAVILSAGDRGVYLDLARGACLEARPSDELDEADARIVLAADPQVWLRILEGSLDPIQAIMGKEVRFEKGSPMELLPHVRSAREILNSAVRIGARPPREWK